MRQATRLLSLAYESVEFKDWNCSSVVSVPLASPSLVVSYHYPNSAFVSRTMDGKYLPRYRTRIDSTGKESLILRSRGPLVDLSILVSLAVLQPENCEIRKTESSLRSCQVNNCLGWKYVWVIAKLADDTFANDSHYTLEVNFRRRWWKEAKPYGT